MLYGSTYAFTLNYYYPDYNKNSSLFNVYIGIHDSTSANVLSKDYYVVTQGADKRVVVTLKASYIRTLADGTTYDIIFDTGLPDPPVDLGAVEGSFRVERSQASSLTVFFDSNGEMDAVNMPADQTVASGGKAVRPTIMPTAQGCQFLDWYVDPEGTQAFDFINTTITRNTVVYAKWVTNALRLPAGLSTVEEEAFA